MVRCIVITGLLIITLLCVGAERRDDALQAGYAAYQRQEYDTAIRCYEQANLASADPGPIAYNLGAICAAAERYSEAAAWYTRSLEDASGVRRAKSAYGLATALTHFANKQQGRKAVALLQQALQNYELAMREWNSLATEETSSMPTLKADAEFNRSIAQNLLAQKQKEPEPPEPHSNDMPPEVTDPSLTDPGTGSGNGSRASPLNGRNNSTNGTASGTNDSTAGRGNLPPLPDDDKAPPLSPEEARGRLDQLMQRLRKPLPQHAAKPGTKDW